MLLPGNTILSGCPSSGRHEKGEGYRNKKGASEEDEGDPEAARSVRAQVKDEGDQRDAEGASDGAKHASKTDYCRHFLGHQLDTGVIGRREEYPHADTREQDKEGKGFRDAETAAYQPRQMDPFSKEYRRNADEAQTNDDRPSVTPAPQEKGGSRRGRNGSEGPGRQYHAAHQRREPVDRGGVERHEGKNAKNTRPHDHVEKIRGEKRPGSQQGHIHERIACCPLVTVKQKEEKGTEEQEDHGERGCMSEKTLAHKVEPKHEKDHGATQVGGAAKVETLPDRCPRSLEQRGHENHENQANRYVDVKDVTPGEAAHYPPPYVRPDDAADRKDAGKEADGPIPALREVVAHDAGRRRQEGCASDTLEEPKHDQAMNTRGKAAGEGTAREERKRHEKHPFPAEAVTHATDQRHGNGDRDIENRHRPSGPEYICPELPHEAGKGHGYDGCVDGVHEKAQSNGHKNEVATHHVRLLNYEDRVKAHLRAARRDLPSPRIASPPFTFAAMPFRMEGMEELTTDVLVIGSGAAGLRAAIAAAQGGCKTLLVSKGTPALGSATILSDGFFGSSGLGMDQTEHIRLTLETGYHLNKPGLVKVLAEETPARLEELAARGLAFTEGPGGMRAPRVRLGNIVIPHVLLKWARETGVTLMGWTTVTDLLTGDGRVLGCAAITGERPVSVRAKATVLCTGGASALYLSHDNPTTNLGDGYALAARAGATLKDMEFVQFYPLVTNEPGKPRVLIGPPLADVGNILNDLGEDLVEKYDLSAFRPLGLRARDRLSRALFEEYLAGRRVFLDLRTMTEADWQHPGAGKEVRAFYETHYRCHATPLPIVPAAHFTMGGVAIDEYGRTEIEGLFAAGEVAWGLHGANRMGGNALSETLVFGARAGVAAAARAWSISHQGRVAAPGAPQPESSAGATPLSVLKRVREILWKHCGPVRTTHDLAQGIDLIERLEREPLACGKPGQKAMAVSVRNSLSIARKILEASQLRQESIGAHFRKD